MEGTDLTMHQDESAQAMTVESVHRQVQLIQAIMKSEMIEGEHYGTVPGCGDKKVLFKSGAEKLNMLFRMAPRFKTDVVDLGDGHREYRIVSELYSIQTGRFLGEGVGSCSTKETKYRYRAGEGEDTGRTVPREYWDLRKSDAAKAQDLIGGKGFITKKEEGVWKVFEKGERAENPDIADTYNTCLKIGKKRSLVDGILTVTAASDLFTQDLEDALDPAEKDAADAIPFGESAPKEQPTITQPQPLSGKQGQDAPKQGQTPMPPDAREMVAKRESRCFVCGKQVLIGKPIIYSASKGSAAHREHFSA